MSTEKEKYLKDGVEIDLKDLLNAQTGRIGWEELQRHFASGKVIKVTASSDLVEVAATLVQDNKAQFQQWLSEGVVAHATDEDAMRWNAQNTEFWAVVAAPWILVQEADDSEIPTTED